MHCLKGCHSSFLCKVGYLNQGEIWRYPLGLSWCNDYNHNLFLVQRKTCQFHPSHGSKLHQRFSHQSKTIRVRTPWHRILEGNCTPWDRWSAPAILHTGHTHPWSPPSCEWCQRTDTYVPAKNFDLYSNWIIWSLYLTFQIFPLRKSWAMHSQREELKKESRQTFWLYCRTVEILSTDK